MELEGKEGPPPLLQLCPQGQDLLEVGQGFLLADACLFGQGLGHLPQGPWGTAAEAPFPVFFQPQLPLREAGQGVLPEGLGALGKGLAQDLPELFPTGGTSLGGGLQDLLYHVLGSDFHAEEGGGEPSHRLPALPPGGPLPGHQGGAGAHVDYRTPLREPGPQAPYQEGHVRPLPPPVGVELVKDQEEGGLRVRRGDQGPVVRAGEEVLPHHVVGEEEVRGMFPQGPALLLFLREMELALADDLRLGERRRRLGGKAQKTQGEPWAPYLAPQGTTHGRKGISSGSKLPEEETLSRRRYSPGGPPDGTPREGRPGGSHPHRQQSTPQRKRMAGRRLDIWGKLQP